MANRTCECCGSTFERPYRSSTTYCDFCRGPIADRHRHYRLGRGLHPLRTDLAYRDCKYCGRSFVCSASDSRRIKCGEEECEKNYWRRNYEPSRFDKTCEDCGAEFQSRRSAAKFCSEACRHRAKTRRQGFKERKAGYQAKWMAGWLDGQTRACDWCGHEFTPRSMDTRLCSRACVVADRWRDKSSPVVWECPVPPAAECRWCGTISRRAATGKAGACSNYCADRLGLVRRHGPSKTDLVYLKCSGCGAPWAQASHALRSTRCQRCAKNADKRRRKALKRGARAAGETFTTREIAERDGWRCHLCGKSVPDVKYGNRPTDPTLDHLVPVSDGGTHTRDNVKLAHMICNSRRCVGGEVQLMLIG